jgi:hypothetical protein
MFQRRMIEVLSRRPNTQLSPNFKKGTKTKDPKVDDDGGGEGGGGTAGISQTVRGTIDSQLQSLRNLNSKRYRKQLTRSLQGGHLNVLDSVLELPKKHFSLKQFWKKHSMSISFILYIVSGTLFYSLDPGNRQSLIMGFYEVRKLHHHCLMCVIIYTYAAAAATQNFICKSNYKCYTSHRQ